MMMTVVSEDFDRSSSISKLNLGTLILNLFRETFQSSTLSIQLPLSVSSDAQEEIVTI